MIVRFVRILTGPPECGTPNFARRSEFRLQAVRGNRMSSGTDSDRPDRLKAGLHTIRTAFASFQLRARINESKKSSLNPLCSACRSLKCLR
jgi:hypothetical protein